MCLYVLFSFPSNHLNYTLLKDNVIKSISVALFLAFLLYLNLRAIIKNLKSHVGAIMPSEIHFYNFL